MADQKGSVAGKPHNKVHLGHVSSVNPEPSITLPGRQPRSVEELPKDINGVPVQLFDMPAPVIRAFTRSQIARMSKATYLELKDEIALANDNGLIIDDITDPKVLEAQEKAMNVSGQKMYKAVQIRDAKLEVNRSFKASQEAKAEYERVKSDPYKSLGAEKLMHDTADAFTTANKTLRQLEAPEKTAE